MPYNKEQRRAYNARKKAERQQANNSLVSGGVSPLVTPATNPVAGPGVVAGEGQAGTNGPVITVDVPTEPAHKLTLKEKLAQKIQGQASATTPPIQKNKGGRPAKAKRQDDNMLVTVLPTVIASFVATYSQQMLPDEYKACAPTSNEVTGMIAPLMEVIGRRVEVYSKASEDAICIVNSLLCTLMYSVRAYITYTDIKKNQEVHSHAQKQASGENNPSAIIGSNSSPGTTAGNITGLREYQTTVSRPARPADNGYAIAKHPFSAEDDAQYNGAFADNDTQEDTRTESDIIADMFSRDKQGRIELGLLRRSV